MYMYMHVHVRVCTVYAMLHARCHLIIDMHVNLTIEMSLAHMMLYNNVHVHVYSMLCSLLGCSQGEKEEGSV